MLRITPDFRSPGDPVAVHDDILAALRKVPIFPGTPTPVLPVTVVVPRTAMHTLAYSAYPYDEKTGRVLCQMMLEVYRERWGLRAFVCDDEEIVEAKADDALLRLLYNHPAAVARGGTKIFTWPAPLDTPRAEQSNTASLAERARAERVEACGFCNPGPYGADYCHSRNCPNS